MIKFPLFVNESGDPFVLGNMHIFLDLNSARSAYEYQDLDGGYMHAIDSKGQIVNMVPDKWNVDYKATGNYQPSSLLTLLQEAQGEQRTSEDLKIIKTVIEDLIKG
jgi:hypothetical protein